MRPLFKVLAAAALLSVLAPQLAAHAASCRTLSGGATVCRQDVWFHAGTFGLDNGASTGQGSLPSWDTNKPAASFTTGAGGAYIATSAIHQESSPWDPNAVPTFDGAYTGDIDTLAVSMFVIPPVKLATQDTTLPIDVRLVVDGQEVFADDSGGITPKLVAAGNIVRIDFAFVNLYNALQALGLTGSDVKHAVELQVVGTGLGTGAALFAYDASEVPSGMIFNVEPEHLADYTVITAS